MLVSFFQANIGIRRGIITFVSVEHRFDCSNEILFLFAFRQLLFFCIDHYCVHSRFDIL